MLYFADRHLNILGQASTILPDGLQIVEDLKIEDVDTGIAVFECRIPFDKKTRLKVAECTEVGNYILRQSGDIDKIDEYYTIIESETDTKNQEIYIYAEDAGLDLLNEIAGEYSADKAYPIAHYIEKFAYDSGFVIGINEVTDITRQLSWDSEATATERLASVATQFDGCELSYSFEIDGLWIKKKYINIHKERGKDIGENLRLNKDIDSIVTTKSIANLATALKVTGGTPENADAPITLDGYKYDDGDIFLEGTYLKSRSAVAKWSRYLAEDGDYTGHICKTYTYDTTSQSDLCNRAVSELKKVSEIEVNYEVDITKLPENIKIGDRINIIDDDGGLYLSARVLKLEVSETKQSQKATLGEYLIKNDGINNSVLDLAEQFSQKAQSATLALALANTANTNASDALSSVQNLEKRADSGEFKGEDATTLRIDSSRGTVFKNNAVSTVLNAVIYKGPTRITDITALKEEFGSSAFLQWSWQRLGEDTFCTILATDTRIGNDGFSFSLSPKDVDTKVVFMCQLITD